MKTTIEVNGLRLQGYHGVAEQERRVGNLFEIDVHLTIDLEERELAADDVSATVSYADVIEEVKRQMLTPSALLEHVAWRMARAMMQRFGRVESGMVRVSKLTPPLGVDIDDAAVCVRW